MRDASHYITETNYVFCSLQRRKGTNKGTGKGTGIRVRLVVMEEGIDPLQPRVIKTGAIMLLSQNMPITTNTPQSLRRHHRHRDMFRIIIVVVPPPNHYQRSIQILCAIWKGCTGYASGVPHLRNHRYVGWVRFCVFYWTFSVWCIETYVGGI